MVDSINEIGERRFCTLEDMRIKMDLETDDYAMRSPIYFHFITGTPICARVDIYPRSASVFMQWDDGEFRSQISHSTRSTDINEINRMLRYCRIEIERDIVYQSIGIATIQYDKGVKE